MAGNVEIAIAGYAARGVPAAGGDELIENQRLEGGTGRGEGVLGFWQAIGGEQASGGYVEHEDAGGGRGAGGAVDGLLPDGIRSAGGGDGKERHNCGR